MGKQETLVEAPFTRTSTRPPPISASAPCPYRTPGTQASRWAWLPSSIGKFIRVTGQTVTYVSSHWTLP